MKFKVNHFYKREKCKEKSRLVRQGKHILLSNGNKRKTLKQTREWVKLELWNQIQICRSSNESSCAVSSFSFCNSNEMWSLPSSTNGEATTYPPPPQRYIIKGKNCSICLINVQLSEEITSLSKKEKEKKGQNTVINCGGSSRLDEPRTISLFSLVVSLWQTRSWGMIRTD